MLPFFFLFIFYFVFYFILIIFFFIFFFFFFLFFFPFSFSNGNIIAGDLIEPRRGGENTDRRWSEAKPLLSDGVNISPEGLTEYREG